MKEDMSCEEFVNFAKRNKDGMLAPAGMVVEFMAKRIDQICNKQQELEGYCNYLAEKLNANINIKENKDESKI